MELISKQAAINTTFNMCCRWDGEDRDDLRNMMLTAFQELPTIDPVKHGKWIFENRTWFHQPLLKCSCCGRRQFVARFDYCPNCGAKMERNKE